MKIILALTLTLVSPHLMLVSAEVNSSHVRIKRAITGCGESTLTKPLVLNGESISPGEWPWIAAIFKRTKTGLDFICGGSLVTAHHVITVGHCVQLPSRPVVEGKNLVVALGKHNIFSLGDEEMSQSKKVSQVLVYPDYNKPKLFDNDLAVLVLSSAVRFNEYVSPACLWSAQEPPPKITGLRGSFIGWGKNENGDLVSEEPKFTKMPIVSQEQCLLSNPDFSHLVTPNTFCAGNRDGSGPCSGDSGGGLYVTETYPGNKKRWVLRGLVSKSLKLDNDCDLTNYVIFTDVAKFASWLRQVIPSNSFIITQQQTGASINKPAQTSKPPTSQLGASGLPLVKLGSQNFYFSIDMFNKYMSWADAQAFCKRNGMQLAVIENMAQNRLIHSHGKTLSTRYSPWIGGTDESSEGRWIWDSTPQKSIQFLNWWSYQPDGGRNQNCLFMYSDDGKWGDKECYYMKPFICQVT